jgi:hypothetical protein
VWHLQAFGGTRSGIATSDGVGARMLLRVLAVLVGNVPESRSSVGNALTVETMSLPTLFPTHRPCQEMLSGEPIDFKGEPIDFEGARMKSLLKR